MPWGRVWLALSLAAGIGLGVASEDALAAEGDGDEPPTVSWSVAPASAHGPDGRRWVELELAPGEEATEHMAVTNLSKVEAQFTLTAADGYFTPAGRFNMRSETEESTEAGTWIEIGDSVTVAPGKTTVVPFTVKVPRNAEPGDHAAGVAAAVRSGQAAGPDGAGLGVTSRFGFRVMTRVLGELAPALEIGDVKTSYDIAWNPVRPGRLMIGFELANTGNTRLTVSGFVSAGGREVAYPQASELAIELLPGESRRIETVLTRVWPAFRIEVTISADPVVLTIDDSPAVSLAPVTTTAGVWALPWPQLICLAGLVLIAGAIWSGRSRSKRRLAARFAEVRAEARAAGLAEGLAGVTPRTDPARRPKHARIGSEPDGAGHPDEDEDAEEGTDHVGEE
jgi:hypothetical protein